MRRRRRSRCIVHDTHQLLLTDCLYVRPGIHKNFGIGQLGIAGYGKRRLRHQGLQCAALGQWNSINDKTRFFPRLSCILFHVTCLVLLYRLGVSDVCFRVATQRDRTSRTHQRNVVRNAGLDFISSLGINTQADLRSDRSRIGGISCWFESRIQHPSPNVQARPCPRTLPLDHPQQCVSAYIHPIPLLSHQPPSPLLTA